METLLLPLAGADAGKLARKLIDRFGGLSRALGASSDSPEFTDEERHALRLIGAARDIVSAACAETVTGSPVVARDAALGDYLRLKLGFAGEETSLAIFVDGDGGFLGEEILAHGGRDATPLPVRRIVRRALELGARSVLLAHNHPSGCATPSEEDYRVTKIVRDALLTVETELLDHLIVTRRTVFSMRDGGMTDTAPPIRRDLQSVIG